MNRLNWVTCLLTLALPASAGDVQGHAVITKRLTKKALSPVVYNLRGARSGSVRSQSGGARERIRTVNGSARGRGVAPETARNGGN